MAKKAGAGERPEKQRVVVEREGQRDCSSRRPDIADKAKDLIFIVKQLHDIGCPRRLVAVVRRHESQKTAVLAARVINLVERGLDADLHLAAELARRTAKWRRHPKQDLFLADALNRVIVGARLSGYLRSGIFCSDQSGIGIPRRPWQCRGGASVRRGGRLRGCDDRWENNF